MARHVFYSFHFDNDAWRTQQVRHIGTISGNREAKPNEWEEVKKAGDKAIKKWIDDSLYGRSCTIVLVGSKTADRKWINYEIEQSHKLGMGLFGIRVHNLLDSDSKTSTAGGNPFDFVSVGGKPLSNSIAVYNPAGATSKDVYATIESNIAKWIEKAVG